MNFQSLLLIFFCLSLFSCSDNESSETIVEKMDVIESIIVDEEELNSYSVAKFPNLLNY